MAKRFDKIAKLQAIAARPGVTIPWDRITINEWRPDTCDYPPCRIEHYFDDDDPSTILWAETISLCPAHATANLDETHFNALHGENRRKNASLHAAKGLVQALELDDITWEFDNATRTDGQERLIRVTVPGISPQQANQIQAAVDLRFGPGVVEIVRG